MRIVDVLEVIYIDHQNGEGHLRTDRLADGLRHQNLEGMSVAEAGQSVRVSHFLKTGLVPGDRQPDNEDDDRRNAETDNDIQIEGVADINESIILYFLNKEIPV